MTTTIEKHTGHIDMRGLGSISYSVEMDSDEYTIRVNGSESGGTMTDLNDVLHELARAVAIETRRLSSRRTP